MKNKRLIIVVLIIIAVIAVIGLLNSNLPKKREGASASNSVQSPSKTALETRENSEGGVTVAVTPLNLSPDSTTWDFEVSLSTHSVDLGQDLAVVSELIADDGKIYQPQLWEGDPPGGHHRGGVLKFKSISPLPADISIKIKGVGEVLEREFKWSMK